MRGIIKDLFLYEVKTKYGLIEGNDGNTYYFNQDSLVGRAKIDNFFTNDVVEFTPVSSKAKYPMAKFLSLVKSSGEASQFKLTYEPGLSRRMNLDRDADHLKKGMKEQEVIETLATVLAITRIGHHDMDQSSRYEYCLAGTTPILKQFVRENGEFLVIFSCFSTPSLQEKALNVEREVRKRREVVERRPLVNFYLMISNADDLFAKVDQRKGMAHAAAIPFTVEEILSCQGKESLRNLILDRFAEYYFEVNLFAENNAIESDDLLFGDRGKIADNIVERCRAGGHSGIFGLRRSGKSSVLQGVIRRLDWAGIPSVTIESRSFESFTHWTDALFDIAAKIRETMLGAQREPSESRTDYYRRLRLGSTEEDYERRPVECFVDDVKRYVGDQLFIIAIDEIEIITFNSASAATWKKLSVYSSFWTALRNCGCPLVVCGVNPTINEGSILTFQGETCDNPMRGRIINCTDSAKTYLPPFTIEQTRIMINTLGGYSNIGFSNVYSQINDAFGGQPWAIRQFCSYVFEKVKNLRSKERVYEVSRANYENYLREFQSSRECKDMCTTILQHVRIYPEEYSLLTRLALSPEKASVIPRSEIGSVDHLEKYGLITRDADTGYITFSIGIIRDFIRENEEKRPEDMDNTERRHYIQDRVASSEKKLKAYVLRKFRESPGADYCATFRNYSTSRNNFSAKSGAVDLATCQLEDFFDHKKFFFYFSFLKNVILDHWDTLKSDFSNSDISKSKFISCMEDLNAGRSDADHYDAEDLSVSPDAWEIDDKTLRAFMVAYDTIESFLQGQDLL